MYRYLFLACILLFFNPACTPGPADGSSAATHLTEKHQPADHFFLQRSVPGEGFGLKAYLQGLETARHRQQAKSGAPGFGADWTGRGPGNLGGRINALAVHPLDDQILYAGFSSGGLFKTTDGGQSWTPIFDEQSFLAIGEVVLDPLDPETVYVGTGDPNISGYPFIGDGVYKSTDGGQTWQHLGLAEQRIVSRLRIHPQNPQLIFAACMGLPFERNQERGLYRSTDGGQSWEQVLYVSDQTGIIDLVMDRGNPYVLYAAAWDRIRNNSESTVVGPNARIYKTTNGGDSWTELSGGLPTGNLGRIGLAISEQNPQKIYAAYVGPGQQLFGIYRSEDGGTSWSNPVSSIQLGGLSGNALGGFGWYFGQIRLDPADDDHLFLLGVDLWESWDGGETWEQAGPPWHTYELHADKHDLDFTASGALLASTDGGLFRSTDGGVTWEDIGNVPVTQFYRVAYNPHQPDHYYGGAQDNGTTGGFNLETDWPRLFGYDGFQTAFHPDLSNVFYVEYQFGGIVYTDDGGASFQPATDGIDFEDRRNFDMPYFISPHDPDVLYTGTYRVYRSEAGGAPDWEPISEDLTDGVVLAPNFHTISTLYESPLLPGLLYAGTTDANLWRSDDGGGDWIALGADLPERYVTDVKASPDFQDRVYVSFSGYKDNDFTPRIYRSDDRGESWQAISGDLPDLAVNHLLILPGHQDTVLLAATDGGVYASRTAGETWRRLGANMPFVTVYDLEWNPERNEVFAGTYGRSILSYPLDTLLAAPNDSLTSPQGPAAPEPGVRLFPNPAFDRVTLEISSGRMEGSLKLYTSDGRLLDVPVSRSPYRRELDLSRLPAGVYYLALRISGRRIVRTLVVGH